MNRIPIPTPNELDHAPQLAILATLDAALLAAHFAVIAAHPQMRDQQFLPEQAPDSYWIATVLLASLEELHNAVFAYQQLIQQERQMQDPPDSDLLF